MNKQINKKMMIMIKKKVKGMVSYELKSKAVTTKNVFLS